MLDFEELNVSEDIKSVLRQYHVDFVFQPIFSKYGKIIGHEALMRPEGKNVLDFIDEMRAADKLHDVELLTFFGATMAYRQRGYDTLLSINSFPSDCFSHEEALAYSLCFRPIKDKLVIEMLEYTEEKHWTWDMKKQHVERYRGIEIAIDDFGVGNNDLATVDYYKPDMIKLDRSLISDIDVSKDKQDHVASLVDEMHRRSIVVLAEGVETKEEYNYLKDLDVDFYQGYYLGRPA